MDYELPIWRFLPLKGVEKRLKLRPGCVASLQHQPVSACRGERGSSSGREWADISKGEMQASAAQLHPAEYDLVSVARSNDLSTYIMLTAAPVCMSKYTLPLKNRLLLSLSAVQLEFNISADNIILSLVYACSGR